MALEVGIWESSAWADADPAPGSGDWNPTGTPDDNPWSQIEQFHNRMDQLFAQTFDQVGRSAFSVPNVDVRDDKDHYTVVMDMPGADKGKINVQVEGRMLSISGQRDTSNEVQKDDQVLRDERGQASFERVLTLPGPIKVEAVKTTYANGVLTITLPKSDEKVAETPPAPMQNRPSAPAMPSPPAGMPPDPWTALNADPAEQIEQFHNQMDQLFANTFSQSDLNDIFHDATGGMVPSLDLSDEKDHYEVRMDMPGANKASLKVKVEGRYLSVTGERDTTDQSQGAGHVIRSERSSAQFERSITLPGPVKASAVEAHYENGVLTLRLPKDDAAVAPTEVPVH